MDRIPLEVVYRHASQEVGKYFADKVYEERQHGKVAILVEDFTNSLYFMLCDERGYPNYHYFNYMTFDSVSLAVLQENEIPQTTAMTVHEVSVMLERPMLTQRFDWQEKPYVFLWAGRIMTTKNIPLEKLNVTELMKLAQAAIKNREGLVIDEALRNKVYK